MRVTELADKLRARGLTVVEVAGWQTRGNEFPSRPDGAIRHWTAGPASGDTPSLNICTYGRSDLPGPLCNTFQSRKVDANGLDIVWLVAAGKANHAGSGGWNGMSGNYSVLGLEIEWSGPGESFAGVRRRKLTSELIMRAMMDCTAGTNDNDCCEHREWAPTRKIDTNLSGDELRRRMAELRTGTGPAPTPGDDDDMAVAPHSYWRRHDSNAVYKVPWGAPYKVHMPNPDSLAVDSYLLSMAGHDVTVHVLDQPNQLAWFDGLPVLRSVADPETLAEHLENSDDYKAAIAKAVVAALPPASAGGITEAQVQAAVEKAIVAKLGPVFDAIS